MGEIPSRWGLLKGKELFLKLDRSVDASDGTVTVFRDGMVTLRSNRRMSGFTEATQFSGYQGVEPGDLVIHQMDAFAGAVGVSDSRGKCSPVCAVCRPRSDAVPDYYARVIRTMALSGWISALSKGIRVRSTDFRYSVFKQQWFPVPPVDEQELIVRYLDHAELRIAKAIAAKQRVGQLLVERRSRQLEDCLIHGLGTETPTRESGIPGVGAIPSHWLTPLAGVIFKERSRDPVPGLDGPLSLSQRGGLVRSEDLQERSMKTSSYDAWKQVLPGDLVLNRFKAHLGVFFAASIRGMVSFHYGVFEPKSVSNTKYFELLFHTHAFRTIFAGRSNGMTVGLQNLSNQNFYGTRIVVPPLAEQHSITEYAEAKTRSTSNAIEVIDVEISLLREYRTRLISDVVTGKLDVREEAAKLPVIDPEELAEVTAGTGLAAEDDGDDE